jgi:hypothetical protein
MADGRDVIEQVNDLLPDFPGKTEGLGVIYTADELAELRSYLAGAQKWIALCRRKVWLRGHEGTHMAQGCLDAAGRLQGSLERPDQALEAAADLSFRLEALARIISTKSQVLT